MACIRTPPDLKWLLNERAALAGKAEKTLERIGGLKNKAATLETGLAVAKATLAGAQRVRQDTLRNLQAMDLTMELAHKNVRSDAGLVHAWAGKYGKRGALKSFVAQVLRDAAPCVLTSSCVVAAAIQHFGLQFETPAEKQVFRATIRHRLQRLRDMEGKIESTHERRPGAHASLWRWKSAPTLSHLAAFAARQEARDEQDPDSTHGKVASE